MQVWCATMRFRRIAEAQIDQARVALRLIAGAEGIVLGRVSTLALGPTGVELMSTEGADPPIETALALAKHLAGFKEQDVDVVDPAGLWRVEWGDLEEP